MHSAGLELTKLTYIRLEDNLIRHRGDRYIKTNSVCIYTAYLDRGIRRRGQSGEFVLTVEMAVRGH